jgi:CARDB
LAFLDEDDSFPPVATEPDDGHMPPERQRIFMLRRLGAVAVGILILILLVLGIRGCLNARKERAFENYARDLSTVSQESQQLSQEFFQRFEDPGNLTALNFETEIRSDRSQADGLVSRVEGLDPPGDLDGAQDEVVSAFELRADGLGAVADNVGGALSDDSDARDAALAAMTQDMQDFLASDVLYRQARDEINAVLQDEGISEDVPASIALPTDDEGVPDVRWLDGTALSESLAGISGSGENVSGVHGLGLTATLIDGVQLSPDTTNTVTVQGTPQLEVQVNNQGDSEESDIGVEVSSSGGDESIQGDGTIDKIAPGETQSVEIPLDPAPSSGDQLTLDVKVDTVLGEQVADNNESSYEVSFE